MPSQGRDGPPQATRSGFFATKDHKEHRKFFFEIFGRYSGSAVRGLQQTFRLFATSQARAVIKISSKNR